MREKIDKIENLEERTEDTKVYTGIKRNNQLQMFSTQ